MGQQGNAALVEVECALPTCSSAGFSLCAAGLHELFLIGLLLLLEPTRTCEAMTVLRLPQYDGVCRDRISQDLCWSFAVTVMIYEG